MLFVFRICVIVLITFLSYPSNYLQDLNFSYSQSAKGGAQQAEASGEPEIKKEKGVYVGIEEEDDHRTGTEDDGLGDIWTEMTMALECSKVL